MNDDSFYSAQRKLLQQENSTWIKSFSKETFPSILMILVLFPPRVFGLLDRDHTYRATRRASLLHFQGEVSIRKRNEHYLETNAISRVRGECFLWDSVLSPPPPDPSKFLPKAHYFLFSIFSIITNLSEFWVLINPLIKRDE